jgi:hypothetical protein
MDILLNENFDFELDHRNDMGMIEGRRAFEQALSIRLSLVFEEVVGVVNWDSVPDLLRVRARRIAEEMNELSSVAAFKIERDPDTPNTAKVTVLYTTTEETTFTLSE